MSAWHVVVIGAGIGGMCATRVLSDHFERVTIVERDLLADAPIHRKGVPQSRHPHGLLDRGRRELNARFPASTTPCTRAADSISTPGSTSPRCSPRVGPRGGAPGIKCCSRAAC